MRAKRRLIASVLFVLLGAGIAPAVAHPSLASSAAADTAVIVQGTSGAAVRSAVATAITSGAAALLLEREPGLTPGQVKDRLLGTAGTGPAGNANIDGYGSLDAHAAAHEGTYNDTNAGVPRSLGTGSISLDRGSLQVQIQTGLVSDLLGLLLTPIYQLLFGTELTDQNLVFHSLEFIGTDRSGTRWYDTEWGGTRWYGTRWYDTTWYGTRWQGIAWE